MNDVRTYLTLSRPSRLEFIYVLGKCLINYGSVIGAGMYQSVVSVNRQKSVDKEKRQTQRANVLRETGDKISETRLNCQVEISQEARRVRTIQEQTEAQSTERAAQMIEHYQPPQAKRPKLDWSKWNPAPTRDEQSESDKQEFQLREQIRSLKVNFEEDESILDMADVAGLESVKVALNEFACFFLHFPHLTRKLRHRSTTGMLLFGPQGTGKTLLVKSFAKKYNLNVYEIRASAIVSKFVGESEKFVRALFKEVRANTPSVLLLDECDGLLCNPTAAATQSHNYRLLQNELKNQWSDLMYSRDQVIIIGVTNKPQDIDMDGFRRRLSLKLHVALPNDKGCQMILEGALGRLYHQIEDSDFAKLGSQCHESGLSGYDIDCLVEGLLRRALRAIAVAKYFKKMELETDTIVIPCSEDEAGAVESPYTRLADNIEDVSYRPFT